MVRPWVDNSSPPNDPHPHNLQPRLSNNPTNLGRLRVNNTDAYEILEGIKKYLDNHSDINDHDTANEAMRLLAELDKVLDWLDEEVQ